MQHVLPVADRIFLAAITLGILHVAPGSKRKGLGEGKGEGLGEGKGKGKGKGKGNGEGEGEGKGEGKGDAP